MDVVTALYVNSESSYKQQRCKPVVSKSFNGIKYLVWPQPISNVDSPFVREIVARSYIHHEYRLAPSLFRGISALRKIFSS